MEKEFPRETLRKWPLSSCPTQRSVGLTEIPVKQSVDKIKPSAQGKSNGTLKAQSERQKHYLRDYRALFSNSFNDVSPPSYTIIILKLIPPPSLSLYCSLLKGVDSLLQGQKPHLYVQQSTAFADRNSATFVQ